MIERGPGPTRDVYANLLRDTRGMRRDHAGARDLWYAELATEHKEDVLFELEMLLKGFACFGNPRNHPGPPSRTPIVAHDFRVELWIVRDAIARAVELVRQLLGARDRAYVFARYLESVLPEDAERTRLIQDQLTQDTPEEALLVLRNGLSGLLELAEGLLRAGRVSHRLFHAVLGAVTREINRNAYFNPLVALEFRQEFDRIRHPRVLDALHDVRSDAAHRLSALALLTLFRSLRYVALIDQYAGSTEALRRSYLILAVLRSDVRTLCRFLGRRASEVLADHFERELLAVPADEMLGRDDDLVRDAGALVGLRSAFEALASSLSIEVRRGFERDLPSPDAETTRDELVGALRTAAAGLRTSLEHAVRTICHELDPGAPALDLSEGPSAQRSTSERLRRDVWMFRQILRGFVAKARASGPDSDRWASHADFQFVRDFLQHFRAIGYQLLRSSDYARLDPFLRALERLRDTDLLDPIAMEEAVHECEALNGYLGELFEEVGGRSELHGHAFDKQAAAETLRIYLGAA